MPKILCPTYWQWIVESSEEGISLTEFLQKNTSLNRDDILDLIEFGSVHLEGKKEFNGSITIQKGQKIRLYWPWHGAKRFYEIDERRILYKDKWLIAYNKEPGIPCQQTPSDSYNNIFHALKRYLKRKNLKDYLAMHHRLDQDTSGVILFSMSKEINKDLSIAFKSKKVHKEYLIYATGNPPDTEWTANQNIIRQHHRYKWTQENKGKRAETTFRVIKSTGKRHLILAIPKTGRTHQIRLHAQASGLKIFGDRIYGGPPAKYLMLHAWKLKITHPKTQKDLTIVAPIPDGWPQEMQKIFSKWT